MLELSGFRVQFKLWLLQRRRILYFNLDLLVLVFYERERVVVKLVVVKAALAIAEIVDLVEDRPVTWLFVF